LLDALGHGLLIRGLQIGMLVDREISRETRRGPGTTSDCSWSFVSASTAVGVSSASRPSSPGL